MTSRAPMREVHADPREAEEVVGEGGTARRGIGPPF